MTMTTEDHPGEFESLLLLPGAVSRQIDSAAGCAPACLEMALGLEDGTGGPRPGRDQAALAARCRAWTTPDDTRHPFHWATSPSALQHVLNNHPLPGRPRRPGLQHYHIVHAASPRGPLEEILAWLRGTQSAARRLARPSFLLTRHGTHWMLAVGARVETGGLAWMAVADPASGRLLGLTSAGVAAEFTPNLVGHHPDWTNRRVAVIPSVLPRRAPAESEEATSAEKPSPGGPASPARRSMPPPSPLALPVATAVPALPADEEARLLATLSDFATRARHPLATRWLAPLGEGRHLVVAAPADLPAASRPAPLSQRAWVLDASGEAVAEIVLRGRPATLLQFAVLAPGVTTA